VFSITKGEFIAMRPALARVIGEARSRPPTEPNWLGRAPTVRRASAVPAILVVDDDGDVRDVAISVLEHAGFAVLAASGAMDAFCLLEEHREIALMFTDVVMPGLDGLMLADMAVLRRRDLKIVYATGYADAARRQPGYRYGPLLSKPYRPADLERVIECELAQPAGPRQVWSA